MIDSGIKVGRNTVASVRKVMEKLAVTLNANASDGSKMHFKIYETKSDYIIIIHEKQGSILRLLLFFNYLSDINVIILDYLVKY